MKSVIKGAGYVLVHTPDMVMENGSTQTTERVVNPDSEYLKELPKHLRTWDQVLSYWPNQVYIGNKTPEQLKAIEEPWFDKECDVNDRYGKFGQMMPQDEFYLLMMVSDVFDLVDLEADFIASTREAFAANKVIGEDIIAQLDERVKKCEERGVTSETIANAIENEHAEPLIHDGKTVGCIRRAHEIDVNLSANFLILSRARSIISFPIVQYPLA